MAARDQAAGRESRTRFAGRPLCTRKNTACSGVKHRKKLQGSAGAWARASFGHDEGLARFAASLHGERLFATGRDTIDLSVMAGATIRMLDTVRAGVEYVGQDLEGAFSQEAEGGARHLVGPVVSAALFGQRMSATAGPALALGVGQTRVLGRAALTYQF